MYDVVLSREKCRGWLRLEAERKFHPLTVLEKWDSWHNIPWK
jgi:hypothetical protein